jgi:hypothetical protein
MAIDDVFSINGSASGFVKKGDKFFQWATSITEFLVKRFTCRWMVKGSFAISNGNDQIATLNYGTGQCDNKASFTVLGHVREISLD